MARLALLSLSTIGLLALPSALAARTWLVTPDGSGDAPTIQAGLDSTAVGDTVEVAPGTYFEHDIVLATGVVLRSTTGDPDLTIIDGLGLGRVLFGHYLDPSTEVEGFTVTGGGDTWGSGLDCEYGSPVVRNCVFRDNATGSCVYLYEADPLFVGCTFRDNGYGGLPSGSYAVQFDYDSRVIFENCSFIRNRKALYISSWASVEFRNCTFAANQAGIRLYQYSQALFDHCIIAFTSGKSHLDFFFRCGSDVTLDVVCTDVYGNVNGDWVDCLVGWGDVNGNFSADPLFCDLDGGDVTIRSNSPCAPPGATGCGLVGARPVQCGPISVESRSWGRIKSLYREGPAED